MIEYIEKILSYGDVLIKGMAIATILALGIISLFIILAVYIYRSIAWMKIAEKMKYKHSWLAWVPFASESMRLHLGRIHWAWIFIILIPILGWIIFFIFLTVATWRIFEARGYYGWLALSSPAIFIPTVSEIASILYLIIIGLVAWQKEGMKIPSPKKIKRKK